jgi:hypothetical protein
VFDHTALAAVGVDATLDAVLQLTDRFAGVLAVLVAGACRVAGPGKAGATRTISIITTLHTVVLVEAMGKC